MICDLFESYLRRSEALAISRRPATVSELSLIHGHASLTGEAEDADAPSPLALSGGDERGI